MSTDAKRTHGAKPDKDQQKPKILMAVRTHAPVDEKTGRAIEGGTERKVFIEGMEDELKDEFTDDQLAALESGGFISGFAIGLPSEKSLALDPTVRAGAKRVKGGGIEIPETANIEGPRTQGQASSATTVGAAETAEEAGEAADKPKGSARKEKSKGKGKSKK